LIEAVFTDENMPLPDAARRMREHRVGSLMVVRDNDPGRTPAGVIAGRAIVVEVVAQGLDHSALTGGEIMAAELITMRAGRVSRRLPATPPCP